MRRVLLVLVVVAALSGAPVAFAQAETVSLMPGVTYTRDVRIVAGKQVVEHVITAPKPGGLYRLAPVLSDGTVVGRQTLTQMEDAVSRQATVVGVNGDLFNYDTDSSTGMLMDGGSLVSRPYSSRSSLGITAAGLLEIGRVGFFGTWLLEGGKRQTLDQLNRPLDGRGVALFTPAYGSSTPPAKKAVEIVLSGLPEPTANTDLPGVVADVRTGGGGPIPEDGAVLQVVGPSAKRIAASAVPGAPISIRLTLRPWWDDVTDAIGGGPALVVDGRVSTTTKEDFSPTQLLPRAPRTAVGQLANGRIILVAIDGRRSYTAGVTNAELARELVRLGAVNAMAFDSGGSTTLAFDGTLLNTPSDGVQRAISNALMVEYYGVYAPPPSEPVVSPNGDGVAESETLSYKVVRPSAVKVRLVEPGGKVVWKQNGQRDPGSYPLRPDLGGLKQGTWRWEVSAVDSDGATSSMKRTFSLNETLGYLKLSRRTLKVTRRRGAALGVSFRVARRARVTVSVENALGEVVRTLVSRPRQGKGGVRAVWNARDARGRVVPPGAYEVVVTATNGIGRATLSHAVLVRRGR